MPATYTGRKFDIFIQFKIVLKVTTANTMSLCFGSMLGIVAV